MSTILLALFKQEKNQLDYHTVITPYLLNIYLGEEKCLFSSRSKIVVVFVAGGFFFFTWQNNLSFLCLSRISVLQKEVLKHVTFVCFTVCFPFLFARGLWSCFECFCNIEVSCCYLVQGPYLNTSVECVVWLVHGNMNVFVLFLHGTKYFYCCFGAAKSMINAPLALSVRNTLMWVHGQLESVFIWKPSHGRHGTNNLNA